MPKYHLGLSYLRELCPNQKFHFDEHVNLLKTMQFGFRVLSYVVDKRQKKPKLVISAPGKVACCGVKDRRTVCLQKKKDRTVEELVQIEPADLHFYNLNQSSSALSEAYKLIQTLAGV